MLGAARPDVALARLATRLRARTATTNSQSPFAALKTAATAEAAQDVFLPVYRGRQVSVTETRYWRIVDGMKVYRPVTPGLRHRQHPTRHHLWPGRPVAHLTERLKATAGRNRQGRITVRHRGGGRTRRLRHVDFVRQVPGAQRVVRLEYDPNRSADLALLQHLSTGELSYIVAPDGVEPGDTLYSFRDGLAGAAASGLSRAQVLQKGNVLRIRDLPVGTQVHCISMRPGGRMQLCRAAGAFATVVTNTPTAVDSAATEAPASRRLAAKRRAQRKLEDCAQIRLKSGEVRLIPLDACATVGVVSNLKHQNTRLGKAGASRWRGIRPTVRGIAMNPVYHPHGGGYKSKGNKAPRSPWGWKTKGWKTVRFRKAHIVVARRRGRNQR